ncbi:Fc.00g115730.m01.CDS01 [Cosmosporella sp. VM-42]
MFSSLYSNWTQFFPPKPTFTENDLPNLADKVYIVTGSNTGVGKELARILYAKNAKIYVAARSAEKARNAIDDIKSTAPDSKGSLKFLHLDLADLRTIKKTTETFLAKEKKLHVLFSNAGVQSPTPTHTVQGHETHIGINCVGTFLFTKLLTPILETTAKSEPEGTVRVIWVSSSGTELAGEKSVGLHLDNLDYHIPKSPMYKYAISKTGNYLHGVEFAKRYSASGVVSIPLNPGNLASDLYRDQHSLLFQFLTKFIMYPSIMGAYTELYAGLSADITIDKSGSWVIPFGRIYPIRKDLVSATKTTAEGGNGTGTKFWEWTEDQVKDYS